MAKVTVALLERALAGDRQAMSELVDILAPVLIRRITHVLLRRGIGLKGDVRNDALDLCQAVLKEFLVDDNGALARQWDPAKASFETFSGFIAEQRASASLRRTKEDLLPAESLCTESEPSIDLRTPESSFAPLEILEKVFDIFRKELDRVGNKLLDLLFIEQRAVAEVCLLMDMTETAVYQWHSRARRRMREIAEMIGGFR